MELLETQDPEKKKLIESSERHRRELEKEVTDLRSRTEKILLNTLIIGGALAVTYFAVRSFTGGGKKKKSRKAAAAMHPGETPEEVEASRDDGQPTILSKVGTALLSQATFLLLDMAKDKLTEYLQSRKTRDEAS